MPEILAGFRDEVLGLGHLDGHGDEIVHILAAAEGTAADAQAAQHLRLVPDADLAQLDAGVEDGGQVLYQLPEIHPAVGGEEKEQLAAVKAAFRRAPASSPGPRCGDLLLADRQRLPSPAARCHLQAASVILRGRAQHPAQRLHHLMVLHGRGCPGCR